jgi:hypothetical protein
MRGILLILIAGAMVRIVGLATVTNGTAHAYTQLLDGARAAFPG